MSKFKVTFDRQVTKYVPDPTSEGVTNTMPVNSWENDAVVEGDEKVVAGALRAMADKLDPPKGHTRGSDY